MRDDDLRLTLASWAGKPSRAKKAKTARDSPFLKSLRRSRVLVPQELKFFDTAVNFTFDLTGEIPASGQWALIPQGDTESTRDGRLATIKSIQFRGKIINVDNTAPLQGILYLWVVLDRQANGAAAAFTDVFDSTDAVSCMIELNNSKRFRILKKLVFPMAQLLGDGADSSANAGSAGNTAIPVEFYIPCNIPMDWSSTTGAITEIRSNNIFICAGAGGSTVDDLWTLNGQARLRFVG